MRIFHEDPCDVSCPGTRGQTDRPTNGKPMVAFLTVSLLQARITSYKSDYVFELLFVDLKVSDECLGNTIRFYVTYRKERCTCFL